MKHIGFAFFPSAEGFPTFGWGIVWGIEGYIFKGITEKEKLFSWNIKHSMGSTPYIEIYKRKGLATGI